MTRIEVPPAARRLSTLKRLDYADAFLVEVADVESKAPEEWMRRIFDDAPTQLRLRLWSAWIALGLKLGSPNSSTYVLGWSIRASTSAHVLLGASSRIGMPAELLLTHRRRGLLFDTFVQQDNLIARAVWRRTEPAHTRTVPAVLEQFARRLQA